jgi:hypothetical protein
MANFMPLRAQVEAGLTDTTFAYVIKDVLRYRIQHFELNFRKRRKNKKPCCPELGSAKSGSS